MALRLAAHIQAAFKTRDFIFHDGRDLRRFTIAARTQAGFAAVAGVMLGFSAYGVAQATVTAVQMTGAVLIPATPERQIATLRGKVAAMQADLAVIKHAAAVHAARVEQRQALIAAVMSGKRAPSALPTASTIDREAAAVAADVVAPFTRLEQRQLALAEHAMKLSERRYRMTANQLRKLGIAPERLVSRQAAMGGPFEPVVPASANADLSAQGDAQFRSLFMTWKKLDSLEQGVIAIPSARPVDTLSLTSNFGVRADPFRGSAAMHAGVDIPGSIGTPIYATADGIVSRAERSGGYGNLIEVNHGRGIATRYGHLSKFMVAPNTRVVRGQLIGLMGSTGRSTGSHLHYEVRIDGRAVNPMPFLQSADYILAVQTRARGERTAMGGAESAR